MRKIFIGFGVIVVLLILAVFLLPKVVDVNRYHAQIEAQLEQRLGRDVSLGPMSFSLYPFAFRVENATIAEDPNFQTGSQFAQAATLFVSPKLFPLLHGNLEINRLELRDPQLELVRNARGVWNFASLTTSEENRKSNFSFDKLKIFNGRIAVTDLQARTPRTQYDHIDLILTGFAPGKSFLVDVQAHMPGAGEQIILLSGTAGPMPPADSPLTRLPFDGNVQLNRVSLSGLQRFVDIDALANSEAVLTGSADITNANGVMKSHGKFSADAAQLHGVNVGYPISADYDIRADLDKSTAHFERANIELGETPISVTGDIDANVMPARLDLNIQTSNASIAEVARLAAAFGLAFNAKTDISGKMNLTLHAQGSSDAPALTGQASARDLHIRGGDLQEPVQIDAVDLSLSPESIQSNAFTTRTGRTDVTTQVVLSGYTSTEPQVQLKLNTNDADLGELLRIGHAYGVSALDGFSGSGSMRLNVSARGPARRLDKIVYNGNGDVRNASLTIPSMNKTLQVHHSDLQFSENSAVLNNLDFSFGQTNAHGSVTLRNLAEPRVEFSLAATGVNVQELEAIFNVQQKPRAEATPDGKPAPTGFLTRMSGSGHVTIDSVRYDQVLLKNVQSTVTLDHGIVTMKPLTADLYNGRQTGAIVVNARTRPATYTVDSSLVGIDTNQFLSAISSVKDTIYGVLGANADIHFTTTAGSPNVARSLNGRASVKLQDGKLGHMDLLHQLAMIGKFQRTADAVKPFTDLVQLNGDFDINNGVARTNNLKAVIDHGTVAASGAVDLVQQTLNMRVTAVLSQDYSRAVGGQNIGGFLSTVLANRDGELVMPVIITGSLTNPQFAPDLQKVAQMKLENLLPNEKGLEEILRGKPVQPEDIFRGIFDNLLK